MKKNITISIIMLLMTTAVKAQLCVNYFYRVGIANEAEVFAPKLMVGDHTYFEDTINYKIGLGAVPEVMNTSNVAIIGSLHANSDFTNDRNYGVLGLADDMNNNHGRNYGLSGMINPPSVGTFYGGAGIYGTNYDYYFSSPTNIQGAYAAYFSGGVGVTGNVTANSMFTTSDRRLSDNIVSLSERRDSGKSTLENLLNMNVMEYNLKATLNEECPEDVTPEQAEKLGKELKFLKEKEQKMTARRHIGVDARELQYIYPDLVLEGEEGHLSVNYLEMVPLVILSIQELKQQLEEIKTGDIGKW